MKDSPLHAIRGRSTPDCTARVTQSAHVLITDGVSHLAESICCSLEKGMCSGRSFSELLISKGLLMYGNQR